jgi:hypothetical protein
MLDVRETCGKKLHAQSRIGMQMPVLTVVPGTDNTNASRSGDTLGESSFSLDTIVWSLRLHRDSLAFSHEQAT